MNQYNTKAIAVIIICAVIIIACLFGLAYYDEIAKEISKM